MVFIQALHRYLCGYLCGVKKWKVFKLGNMDIEMLKATMLKSKSFKLYDA